MAETLRDHFRVRDMEDEKPGRLSKALFGTRTPEVIEPDEITQPSEVTHLIPFEQLRDKLDAYKASMVNLAAEEHEYNKEVEAKRSTFDTRRVTINHQISAIEMQIQRHVQSVWPDRILVQREPNQGLVPGLVREENLGNDDGNGND